MKVKFRYQTYGFGVENEFVNQGEIKEVDEKTAQRLLANNLVDIIPEDKPAKHAAPEPEIKPEPAKPSPAAKPKAKGRK